MGDQLSIFRVKYQCHSQNVMLFFVNWGLELKVHRQLVDRLVEYRVVPRFYQLLLPSTFSS